MCDETCTHEYKPLKGSSSGQTASVLGFGGAHYHPPLTVSELRPIKSIKKLTTDNPRQVKLSEKTNILA